MGCRSLGHRVPEYLLLEAADRAANSRRDLNPGERPPRRQQDRLRHKSTAKPFHPENGGGRRATDSSISSSRGGRVMSPVRCVLLAMVVMLSSSAARAQENLDRNLS